MLEKATTLPDPTVTLDDMEDYGYPNDGIMFPLRIEQAKYLRDTADVSVYRLYQDGTEGMVESSEEFDTHHAKGGLFGIETQDWVLAQARLKEVSSV